jgi:hypothetical protein
MFGWVLIAAVFLAALDRTYPANAAESVLARVILNEIMYHPPEDRDDLQFVELFNASATAVNLSGWSISKGFDFVFPKGFDLPAGGFVVVCRDQAAFKSHYGGEARLAGVFKGSLSHNGERIELVDAQGQRIDAVKYSDQAPWPLGADGYGGSLERICPAANGDDVANWASSKVQSRDRAAGTPGRQNSCYAENPLPRILEVRFDKAEPNRPVPVHASITDATGAQSVMLAWWTSSGEASSAWSDLPMKLVSGDARQGIYSASIPAQPENRLIRFTVRARSTSGTERLWPAASEPRPTFSLSTIVNTNSARVPILQVFSLGAMEPPGQSQPYGRRRPPDAASSPALKTPGGSALICLPPGAKEALIFDHVRVRPRKGGWKVHFLKDQPFDRMTGINLIFEFSPRYVLSEPLAYELYRRAGVPAPLTQHARLWLDRRPFGYYLLVEQPNKSFLRRNERDENGNLYKLLWYGQGAVGQHEKKTNLHTGHGDIVQLLDGLKRNTGALQWEFIQQHFNVEEVASYYAVNMCIQNWDGFFNNYFTFHDLRPNGKWEIFPWDEDKTWGDYDGASRTYDWYEMPLTFGMSGDRQASRSFFGGGGPWGGAGWWRPPGWFSGPLLANPEFRKRFLARLREICDTIFVSEKLDPVINALQERLEEEVRFRAQLTGERPDAALQGFRSDIKSFRNQVANRRQFILKHLDTGP